MKFMTVVALLFLVGFVSAAEAQEKKIKRPKPSDYEKATWGRRIDLTLRYWPVHQHHYVKIR